MKRPLIAALLMVVLAAAASAAFAGTSVLEGPTTYEVHKADNTMEKGAWPTTVEDCVARAKAQTPKGSCVIRRNFETVQNCEGVAAPHIYLELVDVEGTKAWNLPPSEWPEPDYLERTWLYVHNATWPLGYPNCWVRGWEDPELWRENPKAEPGKVFMERIEPGMTAEDVELPNITDDYDCWPSDAECVPPV